MVAKAPLPTSASFSTALQALVTGVNGIVYAGDRLEAVLDAVRWLREHPSHAQTLLETPDDLPVVSCSAPRDWMAADDAFHDRQRKEGA